MESRRKLFLEDETFSIVGCAMEVMNTLGHGLLEKPYENALVVEFRIKNIPFKQQSRFEVVYKNVHIGDFIPDLIVYDKVVVGTKVIDKIGNHEKGQMINYLKITGLQVGLILNFKRSKLEWERLVL